MDAGLHFHRRRGSRGGNVLVMAVLMLVFLTTITLSLTTSFGSLIQASQVKIANQQASLVESQLLSALRLSLYNEYWTVRLNPGSGGQLQTSNFNSIVSNAIALAGFSSNVVPDPFNGTAPPNSQYLLVRLTTGVVKIAISPPPVGTPPVAVTNMPQSTIANTGTWLDGVSAGVAQVPITLRADVTGLMGSSTEFSQITQRTLLFCEVPQTSLALVSEGDLTGGSVGSAVTVAGASRVRGSVNTSAALNVQGALVYDEAGATSMTQEGQSITRATGGFNFRGETEIKEYGAAQLRATSQQSVADPYHLLSQDVLWREGLVNNPGYYDIPAGQTELFLLGQPYYTVPVSSRVYGTHDPNRGQFTPRPSTQFPQGDGGNVTTVPTWITVDKTSINGNPTTLLILDPSQLVVPNQPLKIFVGAAASLTGSEANDFSNCLVVVKPMPRVENVNGQQPSSVTLVTPNTLVFAGDFNEQNPIPASIIAGDVRFSLTAGTTPTFAGSLRGLNSINPVLQLQAADGTISPSASVLIEAMQKNEDSASGENFYVTLVQ